MTAAVSLQGALPGPLTARAAALAFFGFAFAYFLSALLRAVMATLAPAFSHELGLGAGELGLLAGAYFFGFALLQLPLGSALDRHGPKRVLLAFMAVAVLACAAFAMARSFTGLLAARALIGMGVGACLMAPLTAFRHRFGPAAQLRANSWMLMTGSLGMLSSTVPVQWLLPWLGWRGLSWGVAGLMLLAMALIALLVPADDAGSAQPQAGQEAPAPGGYRAVFRHPIFVRLLPVGFFHYGGLIAVQTLWAGPWLTEVAGEPPADAAKGLFVVNLSMLAAFLGWGLAMPRLIRRGWPAIRIIQWGVPVSVAWLATIALLGPQATAAHWAAWCVSCTVVSLAQPAVAQAFVPAQAGRALSAFNLVIFLGVFCTQWALGGAIDLLAGAGWPRVSAYRAAVALLAGCCGLSYLWFWWHGQAQRRPAAGYPST